MKHENSNASTATTSSAGTPPTPEINGNIPGHNNYYQHELQHVPQMPSQPIVHDMNAQHHMQHQQHPIQATNSWDQHQMTVPQQQVGYVPPNEIVNNVTPMQQTSEVANGDYINYAVNEQYSNKFEQVQSTPAIVNPVTNSYDNWVSFVS
jgi:hypothetical protein